jgi:hypothetical protein
MSIETEEWKQLQTIIGRLEDGEYKLRNWLIAILTALSVAAFSEKLNITFSDFLLLGWTIICVFMLAELSHRIPKRKAIQREQKIEKYIREGKGYDGPRIADVLTSGRTFGEAAIEFGRMIRHAPYVPLFILVGIVAKVATVT